MYNVIFLGDRLIAQKCITALQTEPYKDFFKLKVIVTSDAFMKNAEANLKIKDCIHINNAARNDDAIIKAIKDHTVNLLISIQHNWILTESILQSVAFKAFNLHNAKLPEYKGYNSISHAIHNGDKEYFTTIHWMVPLVDSGDIAYEFSTPIESNETAISLYSKTVNGAVKIFAELLDDLFNQKEPPRNAITGKGVFYRKNDLASIKEISANTGCEEMERIARAVFFPPHEPAFVIVDNRKLFLIPESSFTPWQEITPAYNCTW